MPTKRLSISIAAAGTLAAAISFPATQVQAQDDFCAVLEQVQQDAKNEFSSLGEVDRSEPFFESEPLETALPGSVCRLVKLYDLVSYECQIDGPSEAKAVAGKNYFSAQILACYPLVRLHRYGEPPTPLSPVKYSLPLVDATVGVEGKKGSQYGYVSIPTPD